MSTTTRAPFTMSAWRSGTRADAGAAPSTEIDRMYFASCDAFGASSTKSLPFSRWIVAFVNTGLPHWYSGSPGVTG